MKTPRRGEMKKELKEAKKKAIKEYKLSEDFLDDVAERLVSAFHEGFRDYKSIVKEIFQDINVALLIPIGGKEGIS